MNLRSLQYLVAVADERHFSRAAQRCNISQSTLSIQLKKLEDYLGIELIERRHCAIAPTSAGREVVALARIVLYATEEIKKVALRSLPSAAHVPSHHSS